MRASVFALVACVTASETMAQPRLVVPDAPDLMLKTRRIEVGREQYASTEILYLKGARQRRERQSESGASGHGWLAITQCDTRRSITLDTWSKTYAYHDVEEPSAYFERMRKFGTLVPPPPADAPVIRVTIETNDTGERRSFGSYVARHVISTRKTEPPPRGTAGWGPSESQTDGWYIDAPEMTCWDFSVVTEGVLMASNGPRVITKVDRRGSGRVGYPIEETARYGKPARSNEWRVDLIAVSEAPLDDALFEVPTGYQPALQTPYGPDMSKPDTILNRLSWYGNQAVANVWRWFQPTYGAGY